MIVIYDDDGRITQIVTSHQPDYSSFLSGIGVQHIETSHESLSLTDHYVENGTVKLKPTMPIQPIMNAVKIGHPVAFKGLPKQTVLTIDGQAHILDDGEAELTPDHVGTYRLMFERWPYQSVDVTIEVEP
jgi:hypothetical protein